MSTEDPLKNWQLEDRKQPDPEQWKLEDADQDLNKHLQLQEGEPNPYWQPVEYERAPQTRRNWVLPSVLIVALLAVLGYVGWIALGQFGGGLDSLAGAAPAGAPTVDAASVAAAASPTPAPPTPTLAPTATTAPADTPTPAAPPTPAIAMGELISGTVNAVQGVNARREPNGDIIRTLNENEGVVVTRQDGDWLQVILSDGTTVAWVSSEFVNRTPQMVPLEQLAAIYTAAGLPAPTPVAAPSAVTGVTAAPGVTATLTGTTSLPATGEGLTSTLSLAGTALQLAPNGVIPTAPFTSALPAVGPALTVSDTTGVNARATAGTDGAVILVVPNGAVLPVVGRNAAGDWLQVRLPDGQDAWMFGEAVIASLDAADAPVVGAVAGAVTETPAATSTATTTSTALGTSTPAVTAAPTGATATIANPLGAHLRSAPSRDLEPVYTAAAGESFAVIGRDGDGQWVQVVLPDGSAAWVLAPTVQVSVDVNTLPVTQP